jgi:hypothetical protein
MLGAVPPFYYMSNGVVINEKKETETSNIVTVSAPPTTLIREY